jgi:hypothetical protein
MSIFTYPPITTSASLPSGASTEQKQDDGIAILTTIDADTGSISTDTGTIASDTTSIDSKIVAVDTGAVVVASSALPSGASTAANQSTAIASLSNIETDIDNLNAKLASGLVPEIYDNITITYVAAGNGVGEIETVVYKLVAATVATLTLAYDANDKLSTVVRS